MTITVQLSSDEDAALKAIARESGVTAEELVHKVIVDLVNKTDDPEFDGIIERVLSRNAELYRRLA